MTGFKTKMIGLAILLFVIWLMLGTQHGQILLGSLLGLLTLLVVVYVALVLCWPKPAPPTHAEQVQAAAKEWAERQQQGESYMKFADDLRRQEEVRQRQDEEERQRSQASFEQNMDRIMDRFNRRNHSASSNGIWLDGK
jgi:hypothetical protein